MANSSKAEDVGVRFTATRPKALQRNSATEPALSSASTRAAMPDGCGGLDLGEFERVDFRKAELHLEQGQRVEPGIFAASRLHDGLKRKDAAEFNYVDVIARLGPR